MRKHRPLSTPWDALCHGIRARFWRGAWRQFFLTPSLSIPPGHAYWCGACKWVSSSAQNSPCPRCGSTYVISVEGLHRYVKRSLAARKQEAQRPPPTLAKILNFPLFLTDFREPKTAA